ncbi:MAG: hypothetical protein R3279_09335 [Putridiphycobacter sp.]|nr:hypothetical protein [Putridiphycobacter sp.]
MRWRLVTWLTIQATELSGYLLAERNWKYVLADYQTMPTNSVGRLYYNCIEAKTIEYKPNLVKHDMKHIILGYNMDIKNELNIIAFLIGNKSHNKVGLIYLLVCLCIVPEYIPKLRKHYQRGKQSKRLRDFEIDSFVEMNINDVRNTLNIS